MLKSKNIYEYHMIKNNSGNVVPGLWLSEDNTGAVEYRIGIAEGYYPNSSVIKEKITEEEYNKYWNIAEAK